MLRSVTLASMFLAARALMVTPTTAVRAPLAAATMRRAFCVRMDDDPKRGACKWFNVEKGYGFIQLDGEEKDVFVHQSDIYAPGFRSLAEGEPLEFRLATDEKTGKMKAVDVTGPDGAYVQGAPRMERDDDFY